MDCVEGFRLAINNIPDLIIVNKEFPNLDAMGFLIKKRTSNKIENIPVFLVGDFSPEELMSFKRENIKAFISFPINPTVLYERIALFLKIENPHVKKTTPMLMDIHARGKILIVQIEGNLEAEKLEFFNYIVRSYCRKKKITSPKFLFIIPSLYPEGITTENIEKLFKFIQFPEFDIDTKNIKILTQNEKLIAYIKNHSSYSQFEMVKDYIEGMQMLLIDFDREKKIPSNFLKAGSSYIFDLYNKSGQVVIPALTSVTQETIDKITANGDNYLSYYSEVNITDLETSENNLPKLLTEESELLNFISGEYESVEQKYDYVEIVDEKLNLFFRNLQGHNVLVITPKEEIAELIKDSFEIYFRIQFVPDGRNLVSIIEKTEFILILIDADLPNVSAFEILNKIRQHATRRKTSVIILTSKIDKVSVIRYRDAGTDNIVISPLSTQKMLIKVFESMNADRKS
jgi:CheY-like chemotaxis protein